MLPLFDLGQNDRVFLAAKSLDVIAVSAADEAKTSDIGPGLVAFTVVALLAVATFLLIRSMLNQIKKVPPTFDDQQPEGSVHEPPEPGSTKPDDQPSP